MRGDLPPSILQPKRKDYVMTLSSGIVIAGGLAANYRSYQSPSNTAISRESKRY